VANILFELDILQEVDRSQVLRLQAPHNFVEVVAIVAVAEIVLVEKLFLLRKLFWLR